MSKWFDASRGIGTLQALAAALLFGLTAPLAKLLLTGIPAIEASGLLYLSAGAVLGLVLAIKQRLGRDQAGRREAALQLADWPYLAGAVCFGGLLGPVLLLYGLSQATGTVASLLLNLESVFTVLLAVVLGESLDRRVLGGIVAIALGGMVLAFDPVQLGGSSLWGAVAIAGACASWGVDNNITQRLSGREPLAIVAVKGLLAGPIALAIAFATGAPVPTGPTLLSALVLGASGYGLSLVFFVLALRHVGTARSGSLFATAPFAGAVLSVPLLHEHPTAFTLVAGSAMAVGVALMIAEDHGHVHEHEPLEHDHAHTHDEHHQHEHDGHEGPEPHSHHHRHEPLMHTHAHQPDLHHRHAHE